MTWGREFNFISEPVKIHFAGFESDTARLQQAGWKFSAHQDMMLDMMQLAMKHDELQCYGISDMMDWRYREPGWHRTQVVMMRMAHNIQIYNHGPVSPMSFRAVDCYPQMRGEIRNIEDFVHFAPALTRTQEIIVPEQDVPNLLEQILKMQEPGRQAELKRQLQADRSGMRIDAIPRQQFHAQILSIAA